jgi:hypothetical protein
MEFCGHPNVSMFLYIISSCSGLHFYVL